MTKPGACGLILLARNVLFIVLAMACAGRLYARSASVNLNGLGPSSPLIQGNDGNLYGITARGGSYGYGTIYQITPAGVLRAIYRFTGGADGAEAGAGLVLGSDGNFYGTTSHGGDVTGIQGGAHGITGDGTIFKITPAGFLTTLHTFTHADGSFPSGLTLGSDGNLYGATGAGGPGNGGGTIFKITPAGVLTTLYTFHGADGSEPNGVTQGNDGNFYGTALLGGYGSVFQFTPAGVFSTIYHFTGGADGRNLYAGLALGSDGDFYGTTGGGGNSKGDGTIFKITSSGVLTTLYTFSNGADGSKPRAGLTQGNDGSFYGTTYGGLRENGTVFQVTPAGV